MSKRNIVHIEIPTRNFTESGEFYQKLFGWKVTPMPEANYSMWEPEEGPGGGFNPLGETVNVDSVLIYVDSDDIGADLKKAKSLGASIIKEKSEIPGYGWYGIFQRSHREFNRLVHGDEPILIRRSMIIKLLRITLVVREQEEAFRFYTEKLDFEKRDDQPMGDKMRWLTIAPKDDHNIEIVLQPLDWFDGKAREEHAAMIGKNPTMVFGVENCQETYDQLRKRGVEFEQSPQEKPYGVEALARDLYGNSLDLLEPHK